MAGLNLPRGSAPAEVNGVDDPDIERKMKAWVKDWPKVEAAYADMKKAAQDLIASNRELNNAVGQKLRDKSIMREQKKALEELLSRSSSTHDAVNRLVG